MARKKQQRPFLKKVSWRLEYSGYRLMESLLRLVPLTAIAHIGAGIGFLFYYFSPRYRHLVIRNLRIAFGKENTLAEIESLARATCQRTIANFLGTLKTTVLPTGQINDHVEFLNREALQETLAQGKGAVLVLGHMGNWEILNRMHQFLPPGVPAGGIYQPLKNPLVNALLLKRREQDGSRLFNKRDGFLAPATFVKEGGLLIVVADQKVGRGGSALPFFNRLSSLSPLPALLARKAGAPVIAAGIETTAPGKWRVVFDSLGEQPTPTKIIAVLETLIRRSPADYLWLHNRWKLDGRYPLSVTRKAPKAESAPTARVRALVICRNSQEASTLTAWEDQKRPQDLPLSFEFLQVTSQPALSDEAVHQAVAPTSRELATQIRAIDLAQQSPLELVILDPPFPEALGALRLLDFPRVLENKKGLPLPEFLTTQTAPAS